MFGRAPRLITNDQLNSQSLPSFVDPYHSSSSINENFLSSNILLNRILEKRNISHPPMEINARNFYTHLNLMTLKWTQSLSQRK
jgi:hypothetical protein